MYCRNCGEKMDDRQAVCIKCGVPVGKGNKHCMNCGKEVASDAEVCLSCGHQIDHVNNAHTYEKKFEAKKTRREIAIVSTIIAAVITIFILPIVGVDIIWDLSHGFAIDAEDLIFYIILMLVLWFNPVISFMGLKREKNYNIIRIIYSIILIITYSLFLVEYDYLFSDYMIIAVILYIVLFIQIIYFIVSAIILLVKAAQKQYKNNMATVSVNNNAEIHRIFCKNCGAEMTSNQAICIKCGVSVGNGNSYCANCGKEISENAEFCIHCGVTVKSNIFRNTVSSDYLGGKDKMTMAIICLFFGAVGVHNFMMGETKKGIMKIALCFVFGISAILVWIDFFKILTDRYEVNFETYF